MLYGNAVRAPAPTAGPSRQALNRRLGIRQDALAVTCGWGTSLPGLNNGPATNVLPLVCSDGWYCAHNDALSVEGCCPGTLAADQCTLVTTCWDRTMWLASQSEFDIALSGTMACTDQGRQYCAELNYDNGYSTFACAPTSAIVENAVLGSQEPIIATTPNPSPVPSPGPATTTPAPGPTTSNAAPAAAASVLSTGAIVAIAIGGTVVILGALIIFYLLRRSSAKKADAKLREADLLRNTIIEQRHSQMPPSSNNTASWINSQKATEPSVTEIPQGHSQYGASQYGASQYGASPHGSPFYNDYDFEGTVDGTVAGTVDHNAAPRV